MKGNNKDIRKYRRLRRKAKRLKRQRAFLKFILNKIIPFGFLRFFLKKYSWITVCIFILSLLFNFGNKISTERYREFKKYETELISTKIELNRLKTLINQQDSIIKDWTAKYHNLVQKKEERIENFQEKLIKIESKLNSDKERFKFLLRGLKEKNQEQKIIIDKLGIEITQKNSELELKELEINDLKEQLKTQESNFYDELEEIRQEVKDLSGEITDIKTQNRLQLLYTFIERILRGLK